MASTDDRLEAIAQELRDLNSIVTQVTEHKIQIMNLAEWQKNYQDKQIPKCDNKFDSVSKKFGKTYGLLWGLLVLLFIASLGLIGNLLKVWAK